MGIIEEKDKEIAHLETVLEAEIVTNRELSKDNDDLRKEVEDLTQEINDLKKGKEKT